MAAVPAFASFEQEWLDAHPECAVASIFLPLEQRRRANAFGCLVHELATAARLREPQVAAAKLSWWRDELAAAAAGRGNHPVAKELFADDVATAVDPALWPTLAEAALAALGRPAASNLIELIGQRAGLHSAVARIEAAMSPGRVVDIGANATLWTVTQLLRELPCIALGEDSNLPLPLDLLARHGQTRSSLGAASPQRAALLRDHIEALAAVMAGTLAIPSARNLYQRVRIRLDRSLLTAAVKASDPLAYLVEHLRAARWASLWAAWREARDQALAG
jgi:phytoene synthase